MAAFARDWKAARQQEQRTCGRGVFVPLAFLPGEAFQFDWSEDWAIIWRADQIAGRALQVLLQPCLQRPSIDAKVFAFVEAHEFARKDFPQSSGYNVHRLSRDVTQLLLHKCSLPLREIEGAAEWMVRTIVRLAERR